MFSYSEWCTIGSAMVIMSTSLFLGLFFSNQAYDYHLLFNPNSTQEHFDKALAHYQTLASTPLSLAYILAFFVLVGLIGGTIRVYKPNPDLQIFEYVSLGLYVLAVCVFITNIKTGIECSVTHNWGEVTENQGLAVIASSNIILMALLIGVLFLQAGLWYSNWEYQKRLADFYASEKLEKEQQSTPNAQKKQAKAGGKKGSKNN